jgi:hypothetical protein
VAQQQQRQAAAASIDDVVQAESTAIITEFVMAL